MKHPHFLGNLLIVMAASVLLTGFHAQAWADGDDQAKPLELHWIMQKLGNNMQAVTNAISHEDWQLVAKIAPQIAEHPEPPALEKIRILAFMGTEMSEFKGYDEKTHRAARALEEVAARNDGQAVIEAFANLQKSCLACHQSYRKAFVEHFYGQR